MSTIVCLFVHFLKHVLLYSIELDIRAMEEYVIIIIYR